MKKLVSIGLPIYKRLENLPKILNIIASQDYPAIELIVSDNGMNGGKVREIIEAHYSRPCRFRKNPTTVNIGPHFNQIIHEATGEYFVIFMDDDEYSANYVSELVDQLERFPQASVAVARQESINEKGVVIRKCKDVLPDLLSGPDFIEAIWRRYEFEFQIVTSYLARTKDLVACGGYPDFTRGSHNENALLIKLCLNCSVVFSSKCVFRWQVDESSYGAAASIHEFAAASRQFLQFLEKDSIVRRYNAASPAQWRELKSCLVDMIWESYLCRWNSPYRQKLSHGQWVKAAFAMPFIPAYYRRVIRILVDILKAAAKARLRRLLPRSLVKVKRAL